VASVIYVLFSKNQSHCNATPKRFRLWSENTCRGTKPQWWPCSRALSDTDVVRLPVAIRQRELRQHICPHRARGDSAVGERGEDGDASAQLSPTAEFGRTQLGRRLLQHATTAPMVVCVVAGRPESRFSALPLNHFSELPPGSPRRHSLLRARAGRKSWYEPDSQSLHFFPKIVNRRKRASGGLSTCRPNRYSGGHRTAVIVPMGCSARSRISGLILLTSTGFFGDGARIFLGAAYPG